MTTVALVLPSLVFVLLGVIGGRRIPAEKLSEFLLFAGVPLVILHALLEAKPHGTDLIVVGSAVLFVMAVTTALAAVACRTLAIPPRGLLLSVMFMNAGNLAMPLAAAAWGTRGLSYAVVYYLVASLSQHSIGIWIASRSDERRKSLFALPTPYVAAAGFVLAAADFSPPPVLDLVLSFGGEVVLPLMLVCLGAQLRVVGARTGWQPLVATALRMAGGYLAAWLFVTLCGLEGELRNVVLLSLTMPTAVWSALLARRHSADTELVNGAVVTSTLCALVVVPLVLSWLT